MGPLEISLLWRISQRVGLQEGQDRAWASLVVLQVLSSVPPVLVQALCSVLRVLVQALCSVPRVLVQALCSVLRVLVQALCSVLRVLVQALCSVLRVLVQALCSVPQVLVQALCSVLRVLVQALCSVLRVLVQALCSVLQIPAADSFLRAVDSPAPQVELPRKELVLQGVGLQANQPPRLLQPPLSLHLPPQPPRSPYLYLLRPQTLASAHQRQSSLKFWEIKAPRTRWLVQGPLGCHKDSKKDSGRGRNKRRRIRRSRRRMSWKKQRGKQMKRRRRH